MKVKQLYTPKDFKRIDKPMLFDLWFRQSLTEKSIATLFGVTVEEVHKKRKDEFGMGWWNSGIAYVSGPEIYRSTSPKIVPIKPPKDWDGNPLPFPKRNKRGKYVTYDDKRTSIKDLLDEDTDENVTEDEESKVSSGTVAETQSHMDDYDEALAEVKREHAEKIEKDRAERVAKSE